MVRLEILRVDVFEPLEVLVRDGPVDLRDRRTVDYPGGDGVGFPELPLGQVVLYGVPPDFDPGCLVVPEQLVYPSGYPTPI